MINNSYIRLYDEYTNIALRFTILRYSLRLGVWKLYFLILINDKYTQHICTILSVPQRSGDRGIWIKGSGIELSRFWKTIVFRAPRNSL